MRRWIHAAVLASFVGALAGTAVARAADAPAAGGPQKYGAAITVKKPVEIARLVENPKKFKGKTVRLEGTVKAVCQGMGCWVEVADASGASFLARSLDESVLLPKDCAGWKVVVQGPVKALPAKAAAEAQKGVEKGHACPAPQYLVSMLGVELTPVPTPDPTKP